MARARPWRPFAPGLALGGAGQAIPTTTGPQLAATDAHGAPAAPRAAVHFTHGCQNCHGAVGNVREATQTIRHGRSEMPAYQPALLPDADLNDPIADLSTFGAAPRR